MLTVAFLVGVAVVAFLAFEIGPLYAADRFRDLREPTDVERKRLASLRETAGLDVERVAIETGDEAAGDGEIADGAATNGDGAGIGRVDVAVRGPPGRRVLFVTENVLDGLDEDVALGLFAAEAGRVETYYGEFRAVSIAAVMAGEVGRTGDPHWPSTSPAGPIRTLWKFQRGAMPCSCASQR